MHYKQLMIIFLAAVGLFACQAYQPYSSPTGVEEPGDVIHHPQACHNCGYVEDVERVNLRDDGIGIGAVIGAVVGAAAGHQVGDGTGQDVATAAGAVGGAVAGHEIEKRNRRTEIGYQFVVELDDGRFATVTQREHHGIDVGDRVRLEDEQVLPI